MKLLKLFVTALVLFCATYAVAASDFHIEDPALKPVPHAVKNSKFRFVDLTSDSTDCKKLQNKDVCR